MKKRIHKKFLKEHPTMDKYIEENGDNQKWVGISKIVVKTQREKDELLKAFNYIHNLREIDSDYLAVNTIMHIYTRPELIVIEEGNDNITN
jgi:hypothetical protein